jgi:hypothetical protein
VKVKVFVEGGGVKSLRTDCRAAFKIFLKKSGLAEHMLKIIASGSRSNAYNDYCKALDNGEDAVLLIDSEGPVVSPKNNDSYDATDPKTWRPWHHLKQHKDSKGQLIDNWDKPQNARDEDCHLMVQFMESWFLTDIEALKDYYGNGFNERSFSEQTKNIENIAKAKVEDLLRKATANTKKGQYSKGKHSFEILKRIDPHKVMRQSPWAKRFVTLLSDRMKSTDGSRST